MSQIFSGGVFSSDLSDGRAGVEIELLSSHVCASTAEGDAFVIPYEQCSVEQGGYSGKMLFCRNPDRSITIFSEDPSFLAALDEASRGLLSEQLAAERAKSKRQSRRGSLFVTGIVVGAAILIVLLYYGVRVGADRVTKALPVSLDKQIGKMAYQAMPKEGTEVHDPQLVDPIRGIVSRLAEHAKVEGLDFDLHVVDSPTVNAFCLPGGTMVVYTGLISASESPEQLAAVIAHEMSHATLRHGVSRISQSMGLSAAVSLIIGDSAGLLAAGEEFFRNASINSYSRQQESDADGEGVMMLHKAGIDPSGMPGLFEVLKEEHGEVPEALIWISTHPDHETRIAETKMMIQSLPDKNYDTIDLDWSEIQSRVTNSVEMKSE